MDTSVTSLAQFVEKVTNLAIKSDHDYFWRGHSDQNYKLIPSIYRNTRFINKEHLLFKEAILRHPGEFAQRRSYFEKLSLMQHYEFPTRLLDISENPLVALYFACKSQQLKKDGQVVMLAVPNEKIKYYDSDTVTVICALSCLPPEKFTDFNMQLKSKVLENNSNLLKTIKSRMLSNKAQQPITTLTKYINSNINSDTKNLLHEIFNTCTLVDSLVYEIGAEKPHFRKAIWPTHFNNAIVCVKSKYDNKRIAAQQGAFLLYGIRDGIKSLPASIDDQVLHLECIAIDAGSKKPITKELAKVGISEERMFPELSTSARVIKDRLRL